MLINFFLRVFMPIRWKRLTAEYYDWTEKPVDVLSVIGPNEDADLVNANFPPIPGMVRVEGGRFIMGRSQEDIRSKHEVELSSFYLGQSMVTQREWLAVMGTNPSHFRGDDLPVERVNWEHAVEYCNRRSLAEGLTPCYRIGKRKAYICDWDANGYRLPTRLEWYWAAMGATLDRTHEYIGTGVNVHGIQKYFSGNTEDYPDYNYINDYVWYKDTSGGTTHPVGQKSANELGIYDMSGNVAELCWDFSTTPPYPDGAVSSDTSTGKGPEIGLDRIVLGGYWDTVVSRCQIIMTDEQGVYYRSRFTGFRVVRK